MRWAQRQAARLPDGSEEKTPGGGGDVVAAGGRCAVVPLPTQPGPAQRTVLGGGWAAQPEQPDPSKATRRPFAEAL